MAEGSKVPVLGGYDYEFTSKVPEDWECLVCHLTMKDPVQIVGCGHRLCSICMETLLRRPSPNCPGDRQPLSRDKIFPDAACHRKILYLTVKCSHSGCSWTGELRAVEKHQSDCPFKVVQCTNSGCTEKLAKQDLHDHMASECLWRNVICEYCQESFIMNQKQKHFDVCRKFPVECTNKCGLIEIPREQLDVHTRDECPATEVQCEYKNLGCESMFPRSKARSHSETQVQRHLNLSLRGLEATRLQVNELVSLVKDQSQQMEKMVSKEKEQAQKIERLMSQNTEQTQQIERLKNDMSRVIEQSQQMEQLEKARTSKVHNQSHRIQQLITNDNELSHRIDWLEQNKHKVDEQIEQLMTKAEEQSHQILTLEHTPAYSPFVWKIPNFHAVCKQLMTKEQKVLFSETFYLFSSGYKLRVKMDCTVILFFGPFSRRFDFSLYINVVPGEYDSMLTWPCKEKVRVTLIDQHPCQENRENISHVIEFEKEEVPCLRPQKENIRDYGFRDFVERDTLHSRSYIKDDTIFIMVSRE